MGVADSTEGMDGGHARTRGTETSKGDILGKTWVKSTHCVRLFQDKAPGTNAQKKSRPTKGRMVDTRPYLLVGQEGTWKASKHVHRAPPISHGCDAHIS